MLRVLETNGSRERELLPYSSLSHFTSKELSCGGQRLAQSLTARPRAVTQDCEASTGSALKIATPHKRKVITRNLCALETRCFPVPRMLFCSNDSQPVHLSEKTKQGSWEHREWGRGGGPTFHWYPCLQGLKSVLLLESRKSVFSKTLAVRFAVCFSFKNQ